MNDLEAVRREIAHDLASATGPVPPADMDGFDALLAALSRSWLPSPLAIEALTADAPTIDFPAGHKDRDGLRRRDVLATYRAAIPSVGVLLRRARGSTPVRSIAERVGLAAPVWELIEDDRAPAALLNLEPRRMRGLADDMGLAPSALAASLERSLADASAPLFAFGHRPRQPVEEGEPLEVEAADQTERVWTWVLAFLGSQA